MLNSKPLPGTPINSLHPLARGLIGYWLLNDGGMLAWDYSGNKNHGILTNMHPPTDYVGGKFGKALDFNGSNNYVDCGDGDSLDGFSDISISVWVKTNDFNNRGWLGKREATEQDGAYSLSIHPTGNLAFSIYSGEQIVELSSPSTYITVGQWSYITLVHDGGANTSKIYVDSIERASAGGITNDPDATSHPFYIGWNGQASKFNGLIDNVSIYNRALLPQEIQQLSIAPFAMFERPSVARYFLVTGGTAYFKTLTEGLSLVDIPQKAVSKPLIESLGLVDNAPKDTGVTKSEVLALIDDILKGTGTSKSETLTLIDNFSRLGTFNRTFTDAATLIGSISKGVGKDFIDVFTLADDIDLISGKNLTETLILIDGIQKDSGKTFSDTLTLVDTFSRIADYVRVLVDSLTLVGAISKGMGRTITETITLIDSLSKGIGISKSETLTLIDGISKTTGKGFIEVISLIDVLSKIGAFVKTLGESLTLVDILSRGTGKELSEIISLTDDNVQKDIGRLLTEVASLTDDISKTTGKTFIEVISLIDDVITVFGKMLIETLTVSDNINRDTGKLLKEAVLTLVDNINKDITITKLESLTLIDAIGTISSILSTFTELGKLLAYISIAESIQAKESDTKNLEAQEIITDTLEAKL